MTIKTIVELAQAIDAGKNVEILRHGEWGRFYTNEPWNLDVLRKRCEDSRLRIKPETKIIPLEILIDSGIDCVFSNGTSGDWFILPLSHIVTGGFYTQGSGFYKACRPRMNHWHHLDNVPQKLKDDLVKWVSKYFVWDVCSQGFKILSVKEGYKFAWESDK